MNGWQPDGVSMQRFYFIAHLVKVRLVQLVRVQMYHTQHSQSAKDSDYCY